jgi:uncharacterized protein YgiM (DUF1202 family)
MAGVDSGGNKIFNFNRLTALARFENWPFHALIMKNYFRVLAALCGATALAVGAEESAVVNRNKVNVRGGPNLTSEVVTQLQKGDTVTVLEDIAVEKPKPGEPAKWSAIKLPANTPVWVYTGFLEGKTVKVPRLNLRGGPGENFSVLGRLEKGATVKEIRVVDGWMEIEAPDNTRAYVDAKFLGNPDAGKEVAAAKPALTEEKLNVFEPAKPVTVPPKTEPVAVAQAPRIDAPKIDEPKPVKSNPDPQPKAAEAKPAEVKVAEAKPVETKPAEPAPEPRVKEVVTPLETAEVKEEQKLAAATPIGEPKKAAPSTPVATPAKPEENAAKPAAEPATTPARILPAIAEPPPGTVAVANARRIVRREGDVRSTKYNIQAPTYFELIGERGKRINFLNGDEAGIQIKDYKGLRVVVTGEELIDPRFKESPMLNVETIEVAP